MKLRAEDGRRALAVAALAALLTTSCGGTAGGDDGPGGGPLQVVATMSVFADFAEAVGGDLVDVTSLVPVGGDPHTFEPTPSVSAEISDADVVLDNGLGLSPWFEPLATNVSGELVILTDAIAERSLRAGEKIDPHMWMVPTFVDEGYLTAIEDAFTKADPDNAQTYAGNADAYRERLAGLDAELREQFATIPEENRKLVTSHDAYSYFADHYGLTVSGSVIGVTTEEEPSAQAVTQLVDTVRRENVPAIFVETTVNPDLIDQVAREAGVEVGEPLYGDSVGEPGSGAADYLGMMRVNVASIVDALGGRS